VPGYKIETLDVEMVQKLFEDLSTSGSAEERANHFAEYTKVACDASMHRKGKSHQEEDLHTGGTNPLRRPGKTATGQDAHTNAQEGGPNLRNFKYISGKEDEEKSIKENKRRCFNNICEEIDSNPWGFAYKLVRI